MCRICKGSREVLRKTFSSGHILTLVLFSLMIACFLYGSKALAVEVNPVNIMLHKVFEDVKRAAGVKAYLRISSDMRVDAFASSGTVTISRGMLVMSQRNPSMLSAILGHELSHLKNHDDISFLYGRRSALREMRCDKEGLGWANVAGYRGNAGICLYMQKMLKADGNPPADSGYPTWNERMSNLGCK